MGWATLSNAVVSGKSPFYIVQAPVVLKPLVSLIGRLVACSKRRHTHRHTDKPTTVTLAAHVRRGLLTLKYTHFPVTLLHTFTYTPTHQLAHAHSLTHIHPQSHYQSCEEVPVDCDYCSKHLSSQKEVCFHKQLFVYVVSTKII